MSHYSLFVDESGSSYPAYQKSYPYILTGVVIENAYRDNLEESARKLKQKYFRNQKVVFHSEDIGKNLGDFQVFAHNPSYKEAFITDLLKFLKNARVFSFHVLLYKQTISNTWKEKTILSKTSRALYFNFLSYLYTRKKPYGEIVIEASSAHKDLEYLKSFAYFLSPNCQILDNDFGTTDDIRNRLTSIAFVTKNNHDCETQIADLLSYGAYIKFCESNGRSYSSESYERRLVNILERKQFRLPKSAKAEKQKFFQKINSFQILP